MTDAEMWAMVVGFLLPPVIAVLQKSSASEYLKTTLAFAVCMLAAMGNIYVTGEYEGKKMVTVALITLVSAISTYKGFWKPTGIAPYIEKKILP